MQFIRHVLFIIFGVGCFGFLMMMGYAIKIIFRDFGNTTGLLASLCIVSGLVALGFLHDTQPPRGQ